MAEIDGSTLAAEVNPSVIRNDDFLTDLRLRGDDATSRAEEDQRVQEVESPEISERIERQEEVIFQNQDGDRAEITRPGLEASNVDAGNPV